MKNLSIMNILFSIILLFSVTARSTEPLYPEIEKTIEKMSMKERIGQMIMVYISPYKFLKEHNIGSVLILKDNLKKYDKLKKTLTTLQKKLPIPLIVAIDQEGGMVNRLSPLQKWKRTPSAKVMRTWNHDKIKKHSKQMGLALKELGINTNLAPVLDPSHRLDGKATYMEMTKRSFGKNKKDIIGPASAFVEGMNQAGIQCFAKHFPGYDVDNDSDFFISISNADKTSVDKNIKVFEAFHSKVAGIMMTSINYEKVSNKPAVLSKKLVSKARNVMPENLILTDDLWGTALRSYINPGAKIHKTSYPDKAFRKLIESAVLAGNDMFIITYPKKIGLMIETIHELALRNKQVKSHINTAVRKILKNKNSLGLSIHKTSL